MSKSWNKVTEIDGRLISYGFIDDGGHGDRYFVVIEDEPIDLKAAELVVKLILKSTPPEVSK